jgi:hypothetical protein
MARCDMEAEMTYPYTRRKTGNATCGNSFCQEADYSAGLAKAARSRRKQKEYREREARRWP